MSAQQDLAPAVRRRGRPPGKMSPEARAAMIARRAATLAGDPEVRARMSEASRKALADPEVRARMSGASRKAWADPEVRARMSEASRKALARQRGYEVPAWVVAAGLEDDFHAKAAETGEEAAASFCRALKRDMAA